MSKDAYYFSHDSNAKDDPKCVLLIEQLGMEGYGIFWVLIETLRDQPGYKYPIALIPAMARRYCTTAEKMKAVIMSYGLFEIENDEFFYSVSLNRRMEHLEHRREIASRAGKESAKKRLLLDSGSTDVQPTFNECSTSKVKESKVNKSKLKESTLNTSPAARPKHKYGEYKNVLLTDEELDKLKAKFTDWQERIENMSQGIAMKGYKYKSHYLAIIKWAEKDAPQKPQQKKDKGTYDLDEYDRMTGVPPV